MKINSVYPGIFMQDISSRMGNLSLRMGLVACLLTTLLLGTAFLSISAESTARGPDSNSFDNPEIWYIYDLKEIQQNISFELPIIINGSGELLIKDSVTLELLQKYDYQRNITIKDNGTLHLRDSIFESNYALNIFLQDEGKIILEKNSGLQVTQIMARDTALIKLSSSVITSGVDDLEIDLRGASSLKLDKSKIVGVNNFKARENSKIEIRNGSIEAKEYNIDCKELKLISNPDLRDLQVTDVELLHIEDSSVSNLQVKACTKLTTGKSTKITDSNIDNIVNGKLSYADITDLRIETVTNLDIIGSDVNILKINNLVVNLNIQSSEISQLDIERCDKLQTHNTHFDNSKLKSSMSLVEFYSSEIEHSTFYPEEVIIHDSIIIGNELELNDLTNARRMDAYNSTFNSPLHFSGFSEAHLINCSTLTEIPPKVIVDENARVYIYWWLEIQVLDNHSQPLPGVFLEVCDFITNNPQKLGISDEYGQAGFALLGNTISKDGWNTVNNKTYFVKGQFGALSKTNGTMILMNENTNSFLDFSEVKEKEKKEKEFFTLETIIGIIIFIVIIILIGFSLMRGGKSNSNSTGPSRPRSPPRSRKNTPKRPVHDHNHGLNHSHSRTSSPKHVEHYRDLEEDLLKTSTDSFEDAMRNSTIDFMALNNSSSTSFGSSNELGLGNPKPNYRRTRGRGRANNGTGMTQKITVNRRLKSMPRSRAPWV
jgi:hypothetical protein